MIHAYPSLGPQEVALLSELDRRRLTRVTSGQAREVLGVATHRVLSDMARKGLLDRVGRGVYLVRPLRSVARPWSVSALAAVEYLLQDEPHYVGGLIALTLHRLTDQQHASLIDAFVLRRRKERIIANATVRFHASKANRIGVGTTHVQVENAAVSVSDPEKTLLDALDYPQPFGGLREGVRLVSRSLDRVKPAVLIDYALELSTTSTLQRLGVLLERHGTVQAQLDVLAARIRNTSNKPTMVPGPRTGTLNPTWHIIENDLASDKHSPTATTRSR